MSKVAQKYYSVSELAWTYSFSESTIRGWMKQGKFGPASEFLEVGSDVRVPASGAVFFEATHKRIADEQRAANDQVRGRTLGEARRRALSAAKAKGGTDGEA